MKFGNFIINAIPVPGVEFAILDGSPTDVSSQKYVKITSKLVSTVRYRQLNPVSTAIARGIETGLIEYSGETDHVYECYGPNGSGVVIFDGNVAAHIFNMYEAVLQVPTWIERGLFATAIESAFRQAGITIKVVEKSVHGEHSTDWKNVYFTAVYDGVKMSGAVSSGRAVLIDPR